MQFFFLIGGDKWHCSGGKFSNWDFFNGGYYCSAYLQIVIFFFNCIVFLILENFIS